MKATSTVWGVVVRGTAIESIARHFCDSYGIPYGDGKPVSVGRVKYIPKQGYVKVDKGRGSVICVILPIKCECTEEAVTKGCPVHYTGR